MRAGTRRQRHRTGGKVGVAHRPAGVEAAGWGQGTHRRVDQVVSESRSAIRPSRRKLV